MKKNIILIAVMFFMTVVCVKAQSVSYAKSLIEQGKYHEAAKLLQKPADGGDAEAQTLAADLFFEGKGLPKSEAQGIKYARMAANQGYEDGIVCLASHYYKTKNYTKFYETCKEYTTRHPYLMTTKVGSWLGKCYLEGWGVAKNEEHGWEIITQTNCSEDVQKEYPNEWEAYQKRHPELFKVFDVVEQMPSFPGGAQAMMIWLNNNVKNLYNQDGRLVFTFVVERDGSISNVKLGYNKGGIQEATVNAAIETIKEMPKWIPGKQNGKNVRVKYSIPFTYRKGK